MAEPKTLNSKPTKTYEELLKKAVATKPAYKGYADGKGRLVDPLAGITKHRKLLDKHQQFHFGKAATDHTL